MSTELTQAQLVTAAEHLTAAKLYSLASCVMLFYDIVITFGDEVERIWKQRFTGATILWFLNRYLSPLGYIIIIVAFNDPNWGKAACERYVLYPEVLKIFTATAVGIIFILRLYAIYSKSKLVLYAFSILLVTELAVKIWAFTDGVMLQLPPGFVGCILTGRSSPGDRIIYTWVAELAFDSCVFFATLYRTLQLYRRTIIGEALSLITIIMRDGIMYFAAIFMSNLVTVLIFILAPDDLKVINASFSTLITSLMVSRLMLNLRGEVLKRHPSISHGSQSVRENEDQSFQMSSHLSKRSILQRDQTTTGWSAFESSLIGNLGAPVITFERENGRYYDFDDENDEVLDPTLPPSPHSTHPTPTPRSSVVPQFAAQVDQISQSPRSPRSPQSPHPPQSPHSPHSPHSPRSPRSPHSPHSPLHSYPPSPLQSPDTEGAFLPKKSRRKSYIDPSSSTQPSSATTSTSTTSRLSTRSSAVPIHADYTAHRLVPRLDTSGSSSAILAAQPLPVPVALPLGPTRTPSRNMNQGPYRVRRPRTSDSTTSELSAADAAHTRSLPAPLVVQVQVTEEVVVVQPEEEDEGSGGGTWGRRSQQSPTPTPTRRPWLAPPSWRLSRDAREERDGERRGASEG